MRNVDYDGYTPQYVIPVDIENGSNPNCSKEAFVEWTKSRVCYRNMPLLRTETEEFNAKFFLDRKTIDGLKEGVWYTKGELGLPQSFTKYNKLQYILENFK